MALMNTDQLKIESLVIENEKLKAKVKRLQQSKLDKAAMAAMQGFCANSAIASAEDKYTYKEIASYSIEQAKSLIDALNDDGGMKTGSELIAEERQRQIEKEKWSEEHDDQHIDRSLIMAAISYASSAVPTLIKEVGFSRYGEISYHDIWPWDKKYDKRKQHDDIKKLQIAGALIAAEIDRRIRKTNALNEDGE